MSVALKVPMDMFCVWQLLTATSGVCMHIGSSQACTVDVSVVVIFGCPLAYSRRVCFSRGPTNGKPGNVSTIIECYSHNVVSLCVCVCTHDDGTACLLISD